MSSALYDIYTCIATGIFVSIQWLTDIVVAMHVHILYKE
jgi:hypothetical protein